METRETERTVRTLHFATNLPISLYVEGRTVFCFPESFQTASALLHHTNALESIHAKEDHNTVPQYVASRYGERFLYFQLNRKRVILMGAYLERPAVPSDIYRQTRIHRLSVDMHKALTGYFASLHVLSPAQQFYFGDLLKMLLSPPSNAAASIPNDKPVGILPSVVQKTYESRLEPVLRAPFFLEQELSRHIERGDGESAVRVASEINGFSKAKLSQNPVRSIKNALVYNCALYTRAAIEGGAYAEEASALCDAYIQTIDKVEHANKLQGVDEQMLLQFVALVEKRSLENNSPVTRAAIKHIDAHLTDRLTLDIIAQAGFVHPSHLSARFRRDTGVAISSYIQGRRVEEAKHFLKHTQSPISGIASFYQFSSQSHFIKIFKQHTGTTPTKYRNQSH